MRDATLADALVNWPGEVHLIGDALTQRSAEEAVLEALNVGVAL